MSALHTLENKLAAQTKRLPQLPKNITEFLYTKAWELLLAFGALTVIDLLNAIRVLHTSQVLQANYGWWYDGNNVQSLAYLAIIVDVIALYWIFKATAPLKEQQKRGWDYIYKVALLMTAAGLVTAFWAADGSQFVWTLLCGAAGLYLTFSIRPRFLASHPKSASK